VNLRVFIRFGSTAILTGMISLAAAMPAQADTTINIDPADVGKTAAAFPIHKCDPLLGDGPFPGEDVWVFSLPSPKPQGNFKSLTLQFATEGGPVTETITTTPAADRAIVGDKAWIRTSAGLSATGQLLNPFALTGATAVITGTDGTFDLAQTCPATGGLPVTGPDAAHTSIRHGAVGGTLVGAGLMLLVLQRYLARQRRRRRDDI
jgi:hypothetical protein